ncbi:MAG: hypothetical protein Q9P90_04660 [candidate division KSB1 bacterium]|nr:hypothetical protein [candidate division KSB1 bacterium]
MAISFQFFFMHGLARKLLFPVELAVSNVPAQFPVFPHAQVREHLAALHELNNAARHPVRTIPAGAVFAFIHNFSLIPGVAKSPQSLLPSIPAVPVTIATIASPQSPPLRQSSNF